MKWVVVLLVCVAVHGNEDYFRKLDELYPEDPCSRVGGICTFAEDCDNLSEDPGLCPSQRSKGVECCYGVSNKETRCANNGGHCTTGHCNQRLIFDRATDCGDGERCCILV